MTFKSRRSFCATLLLVLSTIFAGGSAAQAQEPEDLDKIVVLNKKALAAYEKLDMEESAKLLREALDLCSAQRLAQHPMAARTHVHLGVVYVAGFKQRDKGIEEFKTALRIDPAIRVTKSLANPEVQAAFEEASMDMADLSPTAPAPATGLPPAAPSAPRMPAAAPPVGAEGAEQGGDEEGAPPPSAARASRVAAAPRQEQGEEAGGEGQEEGEGPGLWLALTVGTGFGYHHSGKPEANATNDIGTDLKVSGTGWTQLLQVSPEIGFFATDSLILSLQGRLQYVQGASEIQHPSCKNNQICKPTKLAPAVLAKATWLLGEPSAFTPFFSLSAGAGEIRQVVNLGSANLDGCPKSGSGPCKDTVAGGLFLFGPGLGFTYELSESVLFLASVNTLIGVPKIMVNADVNLGLAIVH